jgi:hypothetical protein
LGIPFSKIENTQHDRIAIVGAKIGAMWGTKYLRKVFGSLRLPMR